jgi:hypothetical protein
LVLEILKLGYLPLVVGVQRCGVAGEICLDVGDEVCEAVEGVDAGAQAGDGFEEAVVCCVETAGKVAGQAS